MTPATFMPRDPETGNVAISWQNFGAVFRNAKFLKGIGNSVIVAGLTTFISLVVGSFAAFALGKLRFTGKTPSLYVKRGMVVRS